MQDQTGKDELGPYLPSIDPRFRKTYYPVKFTGSAREYFKIWIVNLFLTIITFGIYSAWAKVRTRRYFYANTSIDGHPFDYLASPVNILKGHLIVGVFFLAYMLSDQFYPEWAGGFVILFYLLFPFLIYKSIKFYTHNSAYRNIRFYFDGTVWESYQLFLLLPILIPLSLGFYFPYWECLKKQWFFDNTAFGATFNEFEGKAKAFYKTYLFAFFQILLMIGITIGIVALILFAFGILDLKSPANPKDIAHKGVIFGFAAYIVMVVGISLIQQYIFTRITNYCWQQCHLGDVTIKSELKVRKLYWIRLTNIIAIILSLGLLIPWAKVRRADYVLSCMSLVSVKRLDDFASSSSSDVSAVGDAAADFFDFDFGL